jgi:hypothetical protein
MKKVIIGSVAICLLTVCIAFTNQKPVKVDFHLPIVVKDSFPFPAIINFGTTGFKYTLKMEDGSYIYSPNGKKDIESRLPVSGIQLTFMKDYDYTDGASFTDFNAEQFKKTKGIVASKINWTRDTSFEDMKLHLVSCEASSAANKHIYVLMAAIAKERKCILVRAVDYKNGLYFTKYLATVNTIRIL